MFCTNCGAKLPDNVSFCTNCGYMLKKTDGPSPVAETAPKHEATPQYAASPDPFAGIQGSIPPSPPSENGFATPDFNSGNKTPKPERKGFAKAIRSPVPWICLALSLVGLVIALNFSFIQGFFVKSFGSDEDYLVFAEEKAAEQAGTSFSSFYRGIRRAFSEDFGVEYELSAKMGNSALTLLSDFTDLDEDLSWINDISIKGSLLREGNCAAATMDLNLKGKTVADFSVMVDADKGKRYMGLPSLTDLFFLVETTPMEGEVNVNTNDLFRCLPEEKELTPLFTKYAKIAFEAIEDVSSEEETLDVGDLSQKVTVLEYELDEDTLIAIFTAVLEEWEKDAEAKLLISEFAARLEENDFIEDAEDFIDDYEDALDDVMDNLEEGIENTAGGDSLVVKTYVSDSHEILGRRIESEEEEDNFILFVTLKKNGKFATEINFSDQFVVIGNGTDKNDTVNGTYEIEIGNKDIGTFTLKDFKTAKMADGIFSGTLLIEPDRDLMEMLLGDSGKMASFLNVGLEIGFDYGESEAKLNLGINQGSSKFVEFFLTAKETDKTISFPDKEDCTTDMTEWQNSVELDKVLDTLKDGGMGEKILDALEETLDNLQK